MNIVELKLLAKYKMMENAIKKALEGGYSLSGYSKSNPKTYIADEKQYELFLDPLFWQALTRKDYFDTDTYSDNDEVRIKARARSLWHNFIDHIAEGKSIDSFFEELLK